MVINDNDNFAPSNFWSLCEFFGDCFGPRYVSLGATLSQKNTSVLDLNMFVWELRSLRKIPHSKTSTSEFTHWPQKWRCAVIIFVEIYLAQACLFSFLITSKVFSSSIARAVCISWSSDDPCYMRNKFVCV